ncbi:7,8-didemethyl-8-hydroxy-5-deazariboflavin synthase CofG [Marinomonas transparens]|uniref:7,8-didemethyl-8-hydroxy-5-deazariboflavin synthase n=1 Tax=Marinomonas transparens TaxID=2795388 RepID=A0A934JNP0_9GAMM|nr:7,8-didemethyl-8-hydroxy-5-deazariboflavin synthase CofG [Marinomonas transparens]MBJ7537314.1 7,8-didemethyl-8-hydroxy-5-deazariboflavin synthase CofG [Marinomonas transparens]
MISVSEAISYEHATGPDLYALCQQASKVRDEYWGKQLTYSKKVFIPLTNMCRDSCGYCTFVQAPDSPHANYMTPEQVLNTAREGAALDCKEALFSLGERPEERHQKARDLLHSLGYNNTLDYLHDQCESVLSETSLLPHVNAGALSYNELKQLKPVAASMGMMLENISNELLKKGQAHHACPDKTPKRRLDTLEQAGRLDIAFTTGILIGIGESWEERVRSLIAIRDRHLSYGHIQEVIIQNFRAKAGTAMESYQEPNLHDMKRTIAIARLILPNEISIQAPPNLEVEYGSYINAGINDWGGISPLTKDFINPERAWPQISSVTQACEGLGYTLGERLTIYGRFQRQDNKYLTSNLSQRVASLVSHLTRPSQPLITLVNH